FGILLIPTSLMGATLPIVIKSSLVRDQRLEHNVSLLYAVNTFGAIVGAAGAGFFLVGSLGIRSTTNLAAAINLLVGIAALLAARALVPAPAAADFPAAAERPARAADEVAAVTPLSRTHRLVFWAFGLSGWLSLAYEGVWSRVLAMFFDSSTHAFTVMLATVLFAIALGSYAINPLMRRRWNWLLVFAVLELLVALTAVLSIVTLGDMYQLIDWLQRLPGVGRVLSTPVRFMGFVS